MQRIFDTARPLQVYVELGAGVLVARATETEQSEVQVSGPRAEEFLVELSGAQLSVIAPKGRFFGGNDQHHIEVSVPVASDLVTRTGSAETTIAGAFAELKLKSGSGGVDVECATGEVVIESGSGDVRCGRLDADLKLKSGSGDVDLGEVHGAAAISTGSGDVVIGVTHAAAVLKTGSGDLEIKRAGRELSLTSASGDLTVGRAGAGRIQAKSASGDVRVGVPEDLAVWTDLHTVSGRIGSNLTSRGKPEDGQPTLEIRANSVSGDVQLVEL